MVQHPTPVAPTRRRQERKPAARRRFLRADEGATAVEFAMIAGPFFGVLFAIFQTSFIFLGTQVLETAVSDASRFVLTGQAQVAATIVNGRDFRDAFICNPAAPRKRTLPAFINCDELIVDVRTAASFAGADLTSAVSVENARYCTGGAGAVVVVRALYPMPAILPAITFTSSTIQVKTASETKYMLMAVSAFRNEPFPNSPAPMEGC